MELGPSSQQPTFFSSSDSGSRLIWDPAVHEFYLERCYIYLISTTSVDTSGVITAEIRRRLIALEINSVTVHALFGTFDLLIRFWGVSAARQRFLRGLLELGLEVSDIQEFTTNQVTYLDFPDQAPESKVRQFVTDIELAVQRSNRNTLVDSDISNLVQNGLVHQISQSPGIKLYIFLRETTTQTQPANYVIRELSQDLTAQDLANITIYQGVGFCSYVVKAIARDYSSLLPISDQIRHAAGRLRLIPWTFPVADYGTAVIGETIDAIEQELPGVVEQFVSSIGDGRPAQSDLRREVTSLTREERSALSNILDFSRSELNAQDITRFHEILEAVILGDRKLVNRSFSFLTSIEDDLRFYVPRILAETMGNEWLRDLRSKGLSERAPGQQPQGQLLDAEEGWISPSTKPSQWSMRGMLSALSVAYVSSPKTATVLHEALPDGWRSSIDTIAKLRDDFAHGKLMSLVRDRSFDGALGDRLRDTTLAIRLQLHLERTVENYRQSS